MRGSRELNAGISPIKQRPKQCWPPKTRQPQRSHADDCCSMHQTNGGWRTKLQRANAPFAEMMLSHCISVIRPGRTNSNTLISG